MKAVVQYKLEKGSVELHEVPKPVAGQGEVIMKVKAVDMWLRHSPKSEYAKLASIGT